MLCTQLRCDALQGMAGAEGVHPPVKKRYLLWNFVLEEFSSVTQEIEPLQGMTATFLFSSET